MPPDRNPTPQVLARGINRGNPGMTVIESHHRFLLKQDLGHFLGVKLETMARITGNITQGPDRLYRLSAKQKPHALLRGAAQGMLDYSVQGRIAKSRSVTDRLRHSSVSSHCKITSAKQATVRLTRLRARG